MSPKISSRVTENRKLRRIYPFSRCPVVKLQVIYGNPHHIKWQKQFVSSSFRFHCCDFGEPANNLSACVCISFYSPGQALCPESAISAIRWITSFRCSKARARDQLKRSRLFDFSCRSDRDQWNRSWICKLNQNQIQKSERRIIIRSGIYINHHHGFKRNDDDFKRSSSITGSQWPHDHHQWT